MSDGILGALQLFYHLICTTNLCFRYILILLLLLLLVREIAPELTSVANLPLFCMWDNSTAWLDEQCVGLFPGSESMDPGHWSRAHDLNHYTTGLAPLFIFLNSLFSLSYSDRVISLMSSSSPVLSCSLHSAIEHIQSGFYFGYCIFKI